MQAFYSWRVSVLTHNNVISTHSPLFDKFHSVSSSELLTCICSYQRHILLVPVMGLATAAAIFFVPSFTQFLKFKVVVILCQCPVSTLRCGIRIDPHQGLDRPAWRIS